MRRNHYKGTDDLALIRRLQRREKEIVLPPCFWMDPDLLQSLTELLFWRCNTVFSIQEEMNVHEIENDLAINPYERHVFFGYNFLRSWPSHVEDARLDSLPSAVISTFNARLKDMKFQTQLTICNGGDKFMLSDRKWLSNGDLIVFPDMLIYRGLNEYNVDSFVNDVLVSDYPWNWIPTELAGSYIFVCAQRHRGEKKCFRFGTILIQKFLDEISSWHMDNCVFVAGCSHEQKCGSKCAGNVIIFTPSRAGKVVGNWYGFVSSDDVPELFYKQIVHGVVLRRLWRGQLGGKAEKIDESKPADGNKTGLQFSWTKKLEQHRVLATVATVAIAGAVATICLAHALYMKSR